MRKKFGNLILVLIMLIGVGLLVYPTFSDWWNSFHQTRAIAGYTAAVANMDREEFDRMWAEAEAFNTYLSQKSGRFNLSEQELETYNSILDVTGTGIMDISIFRALKSHFLCITEQMKRSCRSRSGTS